jgi:hypothetical protein
MGKGRSISVPYPSSSPTTCKGFKSHSASVVVNPCVAPTTLARPPSPHDASFRCCRPRLAILHGTQLYLWLAKTSYSSAAAGLVTIARRVKSKSQVLPQPYKSVHQSTRTAHIDSRPHTANLNSVIGHSSLVYSFLHKGVLFNLTH